MKEEKESRPGGTEAIDNPAPESEPLSEQEIAKEARRIMASLPYAYPQDQTAEGQIPVRVSPEFMERAKPPEMDRLREQIPVEGATFGAMKGRAGLYALFPADEAKTAAAEQPRLSYDEVHRALYDKMSFELDDYKAYLLSQPPEEILNHAYGYVMREDILVGMGNHDLTREQAEALLRSPCPLADVFSSFEKMETGHMMNVMDCIEDTADRAVDREKERAKAGNDRSNQTSPAKDSQTQGEPEIGAVTTEVEKPSVLRMLQEKPNASAEPKPHKSHKGKDQAR